MQCNIQTRYPSHISGGVFFYLLLIPTTGIASTAHGKCIVIFGDFISGIGPSLLVTAQFMDGELPYTIFTDFTLDTELGFINDILFFPEFHLR